MNPVGIESAASLEEQRQRLDRELAGLEVLQRIGSELVGHTHPTALYEMLVDAARAIMRSEFSSMQMLDAERGELRLLAFRGFNPAAAVFWEWVRPSSNSTCGAAMRSLTRVVVADIETCDFMAGSDDLATYRDTGIRAVQTTPLLARDGRLVGMISTHWRQPHTPPLEELRLLDLLARQAADAVERQQTLDALRLSESRLRALTVDLERRVLERTADLREANAQMMNFSYTVSHDLRAPVRAIRGYLEVLADELGVAPGSVASGHVAKISAATDRMDRLIADLLAHTRIVRMDLQRASVPLALCVEDAVRQMEATWPEAHVTVEVDPAFRVAADGSALVQVIWNLLANAAKFVAPGRRPVIRVHSEERGGFARLWVTDNGIGIAPAYHERVFKMFERLHGQNEYDGTGIGLALVKNAIERMQGSVGVESSEGNGSRFWIELRLTSEPGVTSARAPAAAGP